MSKTIFSSLQTYTEKNFIRNNTVEGDYYSTIMNTEDKKQFKINKQKQIVRSWSWSYGAVFIKRWNSKLLGNFY